MKHKLNPNDLKVLDDMGYKVKVFSPYHFRVYKEYSDIAIEVFPTRKTYCLNKARRISKKKKYDDLLLLVESNVR